MPLHLHPPGSAHLRHGLMEAAMKVRVIPIASEVRMPGDAKPLPKKGAAVELTVYWLRQAEAGRVRIAADEAAAQPKTGSGNAGGKKGGGQQ